MRGDGTESLCDMDECGEVCLVVLKVHRRSEPLLGSIGEGVCRTHAPAEIIRIVDDLSQDGDVTGLSVVLV